MKVKKIDLFLVVLGLVVALGLYHKETLEQFAFSYQNAWINVEPNVGINKIGQLYYFGPINNKGYELLKQSYFDYKGKMNKAIIIESRGGDAFAAMKIGRFIKRKKLSVKVPNFCLADCAHYIFPAAVFKYLGKNALIGFYEPVMTGTQVTFADILTNIKENSNKLTMDSNDFIQADTSLIPEKCVFHPELVNTQVLKEEMIQHTVNSCFNYLQSETEDFYEELTADSRLLEIGMTKLRKAKISNNGIHSFYYDAESLKALGVERVIFPYQWTPENNPEYQHTIEIKRSDW